MSANVLVQTAFLGDLLLSIPLMKTIKALWPEQKLILVCRKGLGDFFIKTGLVDSVYEIRKGHRESYNQVLVELNKQEIVRVVCPHQSFRTALFVRKIAARDKISFAKFWNGIVFSRRVKIRNSCPDAIRQLSLLANDDLSLAHKIDTYESQGRPYETTKDGVLSPVPEWASMSLTSYYRDHQESVQDLLGRLNLTGVPIGKMIAVFPGSVWPTKRWAAQGFVEMSLELKNKGWEILIMGGPGEETLCEEICAQIPGARNICGLTSIFESALILSQVAAVVGNDSASMHLAATCEAPSVAIFGPTVLEFGFRPWHNRVAIVENRNLSCRPCGKHGHKTCPLGTHECMKSVSKNEVVMKLEKVL